MGPTEQKIIFQSASCQCGRDSHQTGHTENREEHKFLWQLSDVGLQVLSVEEKSSKEKPVADELLLARRPQVVYCDELGTFEGNCVDNSKHETQCLWQFSLLVLLLFRDPFHHISHMARQRNANTRCSKPNQPSRGTYSVYWDTRTTGRKLTKSSTLHL